MPDLKDWGIYVYFAADVPSQAMRRAARRNLQKFADVGSNRKVGITAMLDVSDQDTQLYVIPPQPVGKDEWIVEPSLTLPNVNSASTEAIQQFFQWSVDNCPARKIAFVFYGHGYAIDDFDPRLEQQMPPNSEASESEFAEQDDMGREFESQSGDGLSARGNAADRFARSRSLPLKLIFDSTHNAVLNNDQVADVIRASKKTLPKDSELAILGFDCCNMAMAEVLCEMSGCADIAVAAETGLPFQSWVSQSLLQKVLAGAPPDPEGLAETAVHDFIQSFANKTSTYVAISACNLALCKELEAAAERLVRALIETVEDEASRAAIFRSRNDCVCFDPDGFIDFDCFCGFLSEDLAGTAAAEACIPVRKVLREFVIASEFAPNFPDRRISLSTGLSIWFPPWIQNPEVQIPQKEQSIEYFQNGYHRTRFARATGWDRFLSRLIDETHGMDVGRLRVNQFSLDRSLGKASPLGRTPPDIGRTPPDIGRTPPDIGRTPPDIGKDVDTSGTACAAQGTFESGSTRVAGVVLRGFVEAYGPLGDTELTLNVKWPAGSIGPLPGGSSAYASSTPAPVIRSTPFSGPQKILARRPPALSEESLPSEERNRAREGTPAKKAAKRVPARIAAKRAPSSQS
jgi:hypothetical protein